MRLVIAGLAGLASLPAAQGCLVRECSLVGFNDGLELGVDVHHEPGHYRLEVVAEGDTLALAYDVALGELPKCIGNCLLSGDHISLETRDYLADSDFLRAYVHGPRPNDNPTHLTVRVFRADAMLVEQDLDVTYEDIEYNGPGCGTAQSASATVTVP